MSLSFQDQYTTTFAGIYKGFHFLARGARYRVDVIEDPNRVVVSVDAINSELRGELRKLNWLGVTHLYFTFDPDRNVVMLERHGLIAHMHISLGCAAAIETPPKEPSVDQEDALGGDKEVDDFLFELIKLLLS
ncbi:hypothetical protein Pmar_PMAR008564 [Perkinsus marinus ATCC 50983]|uniref:Uncharacterized protein n=1 Tax=Perkinsus marinus (strain ATCC 50983 / TXsc) TaxID=423536 RepID=C5L5F0_PERM5|nr:hypothetical protein Pmar_PMAR008564 [Perkinsus marinus ATCC 50983]EER08043.1 hypothetical protein Pmar_PMAR008564 [Perkinsus marinus ATCC 50983]|eukprot:XP_002776227.1 hypothetical protein Pmar_PMAR008564 [Perkinsus marinus ATCC 50983]